MSFTRRIVLVGLALFIGFCLYHAISPWGWSTDLQTPPGVPTQSVSYTCGAPWGSGYVHGPTNTAYPIGSTPCGQRTEYQLMTAIDVLIGVFAFAVVGGWTLIRPTFSASLA